MLQNDLSCFLILLFVSCLLCWLLWTRPKPVASAILVHSLSTAAFCLRNFHCCRHGNRFVHHVVVRHGNLTSVRDVVLMRFLFVLQKFEFFEIWWFMFSWLCYEHEWFNLVVSISDPSFPPRSLPAWTVRIGWFGNVARQRRGSSYFQFTSHCSWFLLNKDHFWKYVQ